MMTGIPIRHGVAWDVEIALGLRVAHNSGDDSRWGFARARAGLLLFREPTFLSVGIAGQYGPLGSSALGIEAQVVDIQKGIWLQLGGFPIDSVGSVIEVGFGFSLFGVEWQRRVSGTQSGDQVLLVVLEVPLGLIRQLLKPPPGLIIAPRTADATAPR
jgi:hypothetical protein